MKTKVALKVDVCEAEFVTKSLGPSLMRITAIDLWVRQHDTVFSIYADFNHGDFKSVSGVLTS